MTGGATVSTQSVTSGSVPRPSVIYVADFSVASGAIQPSSGIVDEAAQALGQRPRLLGGGILRGGPLGAGGQGELGTGGGQAGGGIGQRLLGDQLSDAQVVEILSSSIVRSLNGMQLGLAVIRLPAAAALPASGWLVRGQITSVDPGSRAQRAVVGFGVGEATAQVQAQLDQLGPGGPSPIAELGGQAESGKAPGAVVTLNPYVAAAKLVMTKDATGRDIESLGAAIAKRVAAFVEAQGAPVTVPPQAAP